MTKHRRLFQILGMLATLGWASGCSTVTPASQTYGVEGGNQLLLKPEHQSPVSSVKVSEPPPGASKSVTHKMLWYIPNRLLDVVDIVRLRARAGPGLALNLRVTDYADVYMGRYHTVYLGLPGPRMGKELGWFAGWEQERGIKLFGVDATDDLDDEADYSPTEFNLGAQLLIVGAEIGFDPVELGDFLAGFLLIDLREDDW